MEWGGCTRVALVVTYVALLRLPQTALAIGPVGLNTRSKLCINAAACQCIAPARTLLPNPGRPTNTCSLTRIADKQAHKCMRQLLYSVYV